MMNLNRPLMAIAALGLSASLSHAELVTYLNLDSPAGLRAELENNPGGTAAITSGRSGYLGEAARFDGHGYYSVLTEGGIAGAGARTYTAWVKLDSTAEGVKVAFGSGLNGEGTKFDLAVDDAGNVEGAVGRGRSETSLVLEPDAWQFVAISVRADGTAGDIISYINDVAQGSTPNPRVIQTLDASLRIGVGSNNNVGFSEEYWLGLVDEVSIWDEQLSADELKGLYDVGRELSYTADQFNALKKVHDAAGGSAIVEGREWQYATNLAGGAGLKGGKQLILDAAAGTGLVAYGERVSIPEPASFPIVVGLLGLVVAGIRRR